MLQGHRAVDMIPRVRDSDGWILRWLSGGDVMDDVIKMGIIEFGYTLLSFVYKAPQTHTPIINPSLLNMVKQKNMC